MTTVASRTFSSSPRRDAPATWAAIVELLTRAQAGSTRDELLSVHGVAASVIADRGPENAAITVTCDGPRTRIYCVYDDDAVDGSDANEEPLGFDPLKGDWKVSLPCHADDLGWIKKALASKTERITARELDAKVEASAQESSSGTLTLDAERFLKL